MRWKSKELRRFEYRAKVAEWHDWFAWHPVKMDGVRVWLETIQRKGTVHAFNRCGTVDMNWLYREKLDEPHRDDSSWDSSWHL